VQRISQTVVGVFLGQAIQRLAMTSHPFDIGHPAATQKKRRMRLLKLMGEVAEPRVTL
jgi:hypothetical protein